MATTVAPNALYGIYKLIDPHYKTNKVGGVVGDAAHGSGYHLSRDALKARGLTGDYSIQCPADKRGPGNAAAAIDITFGDLAELVTCHKRLRAACTPNAKGDYDPRIECVREHIGTLDGKKVSGYNRVATGSGSRSRVGWVASGFSDSSHLWHEHVSVLRDYVDDTNAMKGLAEVIAGVKPGTFGWKGATATTPATPATSVPPKEPVVPKPPKFVIALDAPGAGNWQGIAQNVVTGEWFIAHSQKREDGAEDTHFYRFDKAGAYQDKMTLVKGGHVLGFGVSDTNVIWTTYNDASGNDVVTVQYEGSKAGVQKTKADCTPMHVFTDGNAQISFSPSRDWCAVLERTSDYDTVRRYAKSDILDNKDNPRGLPVRMKRSPGRTIQGFAPVNANLYVLTGMTLGEAAIEVWSFDTGEKVATHKLGGGTVLAGVVSDKIEPEGCDGRLFGMKVGTDAARRLHVFKQAF